MVEHDVKVGEPIPIEEIPVRRVKRDWVKILESIPEGQAQEVSLTYTSCKEAIKKLVEKGKVKEGEYDVKTTRRKEGGKERRTFIIHNKTER